MDISGILRMLIDSKSKESAHNDNSGKDPMNRIELIKQNLECHKAYIRRCSYFDWLEKKLKITILERMNGKLKHSEALAHQEGYYLLEMMSRQSRMYEMEDEGLTTRISRQKLMNEESQFPYILHLHTMKDDGAYAWIMAENRQHTSCPSYFLRYKDDIFHLKKQPATTDAELFTHLIEWCGKIMETRPLAFGVGYHIAEEDFYNWDANLLFKLPETPPWNNHDLHPGLKRFAQANLTVVPRLRKSLSHGRTDGHHWVIKEPRSSDTKWQRHQ